MIGLESCRSSIKKQSEKATVLTTWSKAFTFLEHIVDWKALYILWRYVISAIRASEDDFLLLMFKGSNMIVCVLLVSNSRGCYLAAPDDHEGALVIARRGETTHSRVDVNNTHLSMINPLTKSRWWIGSGCCNETPTSMAEISSDWASTMLIRQ